MILTRYLVEVEAPDDWTDSEIELVSDQIGNLQSVVPVLGTTLQNLLTFNVALGLRVSVREDL